MVRLKLVVAREQGAEQAMIYDGLMDASLMRYQNILDQYTCNMLYALDFTMLLCGYTKANAERIHRNGEADA